MAFFIHSSTRAKVSNNLFLEKTVKVIHTEFNHCYPFIVLQKSYL